MKKILYISVRNTLRTLVFGALATVCGCVHESVTGISETGSGNVLFSIQASGPAGTRALAVTDESDTREIVVLVFERDAARTFRSMSVAEDITTVSDDVRKFSVVLPKGTFDFVFLANAKYWIEQCYASDSGEIPDDGTETYSTIQAKLKASVSGKWPYLTTDPNYRAIPMWGELTGGEVKDEANVYWNRIPMSRMLAKISVTVDDAVKDIFQLNTVWVFYNNTEGYIIPDLNNWNSTDHLAVKPTVSGFTPVRGPLVWDEHQADLMWSESGYQLSPVTLGGITYPGRIAAVNALPTMTWTEAMGIDPRFTNEDYFTSLGLAATIQNMGYNVTHETGCGAYWELAENHPVTGKGKWRLATQQETIEMRDNLSAINPAETFPAAGMWCSWELGMSGYIIAVSPTVNQVPAVKTDYYYSRCVRDTQAPIGGPAADYSNEIYLFEVANDDPSQTGSERPYIVVGGYYDNNPEESFYRINLKDDQGNWFDILRNHHYKLNIEAVSGPGGPDPEAGEIDADFSMEIVDWETGYEEDVIPGTYILNVTYISSYDLLNLTGSSWYPIFIIETTHPDGWTPEAYNEDGTPCDWIKESAWSSPGQEWFYVDSFQHSQGEQQKRRTGYLHIKSGNMTKVIKISQLSQDWS